VHVSVSSPSLSDGPWPAKILGMHDVEEENTVGGDDGRVLTRWGWRRVRTAK